MRSDAEPSKTNGRKRQRKNESDDDSPDGDDTEETTPEQHTRRGRPARKAEWAFAMFKTPVAVTRDGKLFWRWTCGFCESVAVLSIICSVLTVVNSSFRTSPRTRGCKQYKDEKLDRPNPSNFISHLEKCKQIPPEYKFEAWTERRKQELSADSGASTGGIVTSDMGSEIMRAFVQRGKESPAQELTKKGFRMHFVKGIIEDDLPFTFGEGQGMSRCFTYILPKSYKVPGRMVVRRDLGLLHVSMNKKLNTIIQV